MANPPPSKFAGAISRLSPKHRQYLILGLGIGAFLLLVFGGVAIWDKPVQLPQGNNQSRPQPMPIATPGAQADPRDIWMSKSAEQMRQMEDMIQGLRQQVDTLDKKPTSASPDAGADTHVAAAATAHADFTQWREGGPHHGTATAATAPRHCFL